MCVGVCGKLVEYKFQLQNFFLHEFLQKEKNVWNVDNSGIFIRCRNIEKKSMRFLSTIIFLSDIIDMFKIIVQNHFVYSVFGNSNT